MRQPDHHDPRARHVRVRALDLLLSVPFSCGRLPVLVLPGWLNGQQRGHRVERELHALDPLWVRLAWHAYAAPSPVVAGSSIRTDEEGHGRPSGFSPVCCARAYSL